MENQMGAESTSFGSGRGDNGGMMTLKEPSKQLDLINNEATEDDDGEKLVKKVFGNHVVVGRIMSYLDHTSIKFLSQTCQMLLGIVRGKREFLDRTKINISRSVEVFPMISFDPSNFPWKHVSVQLDVGSREEHLAMLPLLSKVEALEIYSSDMDPLQHPAKVQVRRLIDCLNAAGTIKELTIGVEIVTTADPKVLATLIRNSEKAKSNLEKLKSLSITTGQVKYDNDNLSGPKFSPSILALAVEFPTCLTSLTLHRSVVRHDQVVMAVVALLEKHKGTLRGLSFGSYNLQEDGEEAADAAFYEIVFPALKELHFRAEGCKLTVVASWLAKQPPLDSLSLKFTGVPVGISRPLVTPLLIHGPTLKEFSLVWRLNEVTPMLEPLFFPNSDGEDGHPRIYWPPPGIILPPPTPWDFSFLENFGSLRELKVHHLSLPKSHLNMARVCRHKSTSPGSILAAVPGGIKKIDVSGEASGSWNQDEPHMTLESLGRFRNLTVLNLTHCARIVNDEILRFIFTNMSQLREFGFSHCHRVTDSGLIGKFNVPGIQALTGLVTLRIMSCPKLTLYAFLTSLSFRDLKFLTLIIKTKTNQSYYKKIADQNKSLEVLEISSEVMQKPDKDDPWGGLEEALKRQSPRFRTLKLMNPPAPNLRDFSSGEEDEGSEEEEDD